MATDEIEIRRGTARAVLTPSTAADFEYINANLRFYDKFEQDHFCIKCKAGKPDSLDQMEQSYTLHLGGEIVGYVALMVTPNCTVMSTSRFMPMLTTTNVEHHPLDFARLSKPVLEYVMRNAAPWVSDFFTLPLARYEATVRWHEKTMRWHRVAEFEIEGEKAILFHLNRKEIKS